MKVAVLGGGPAGLYFAISMKLKSASHDVTVVERNRPDDTFGWGVVLSAETLENLERNDPVSAVWIKRYFSYWDDVVVVHKGVRTVSTGHGFCGIGRKRLLMLLQRRARELGVNLVFETNVPDPKAYMESHDLVVAADGLNSVARTTFEDVFKPDIDIRKCKFVWLGTEQKFDDAFTFIFEETEHGWVWAHAYQFDPDTATFIVECSQETWDSFGFGAMSQQESIAVCERIFAKHLGGHSLMTNANHIRGSAWINFPRVLCERWSYKNLALLGDAAASAHFSIGSGTKLALESAVALAGYVHSEPSLEAAFDKYEEERRTEVLKLQSAARNSLEWFEEVERYLGLDPVQFNYSLLTRSQRISHENLRLRDPEWLAGAEAWFQRKAGAGEKQRQRAPMFAPYQLREMKLKNRVVVSPMAQYKAVDGCPTDWHFTHYAERAKGGAGLVYIEMTCVSPEGRITPGCPGFYAPEHEAAWTRLVEFVHARDRGENLRPDRPFGRQGFDQGRLGRHRRAARNGQLADHGGVGCGLVATEPGAEGDGPRRHGHGARPVRGVDADGRALRLRHARDTCRARLSAVVLHHACHQPPHGRIWRLAGKPHAASARSVPRACARCGLTNKPISIRISANDWVGVEGVTPADAVEIARSAERGRSRHLRRLGRPDLGRCAAGLRPHVPDAVFRPDPQRSRHGDHGRRQHLRA